MIEGKPGLRGGHDVVAQLMATTGRTDFASTGRVPESGLNSSQHHRGMHHGDHDEAGRPTNAVYFTEQAAKICDVVNDQPANNPVKSSIVEWQWRCQVVCAKDNTQGASLCSRSGQHSFRKVHRLNDRSRCREP